jgi:hypothetical protein
VPTALGRVTKTVHDESMEHSLAPRVDLDSPRGKPVRVYHFLPVSFALMNIEKRRIKISQIDQLNDPFICAKINFKSEWK